MEKIDTKEKIINCALKLVLANGFNAFSYADIAEDIGIRKASIHYHFPSKADLGLALINSYRQNFVDILSAPENANLNPKEIIYSYIEYWRHCIETREKPVCLMVILSSELPSLPNEMVAPIGEYFAFTELWLAGVFAQFYNTNIESETIRACEFLAILHGAMLSARAQNNPNLFTKIMHRHFI